MPNSSDQFSITPDAYAPKLKRLRQFSKILDNIITIPTLDNPLMYPLLEIIPLQLFAYYFAKELGRNIDKPRNLAKSVTVE